MTNLCLQKTRCCQELHYAFKFLMKIVCIEANFSPAKMNCLDSAISAKVVLSFLSCKPVRIIISGEYNK